MLGSIFNKAVESSGQSISYGSFNELTELTIEESIEHFNANRKVYKGFRGMSTKEVQKMWGNDKIKTSEGIVETREVEYTLSGWVENFEHYLKSAMSYTDSLNLSQFIGNITINMITENSYNRFKK